RGQAIMAKASAIVQREEQERARQEAQRPPRDPREAGHPDHALNQSIRAQVEKLHTRNGICPTNKTLDYLTASVALNARESGLTRVDQLHFNADKSVIVAERKSDGLDFLPRFSSTNIQQAMQTPPEQAYQQMAAETQRQADAQQMIQQQMAQSRQGPSQGR
ncbi:XVIPCD domain-containing protein, partial [Xanthomonas albilineans]